MTGPDDAYYMRMALEQAQEAARAGEVPVGAVLVMKGEAIARDHNRCVTTHDPTAHAEILVIRKAAQKIGDYRLADSDLYVTVEPCPMCAGAMIQARISRLIFGAPEEKTGVVQSHLGLLVYPFFNHRVRTAGGVLEEECRLMIQAFFKEKRDKERDIGRGTEVAITGPTRNRLSP